MPTTAAEWLEEHPDDLVLLEEMVRGAGLSTRILTELPTWMKERIVKNLQQSFAQDYWDDISLATAGDAEAFLTRGLQEGWSIRRMATEMANSFMGDTQQYALRRSTLIARTESGNALNGARREAIDGLAEILGPEVPMKVSWLSVLGNTTRATHANLDGVPADKDGLWNLSGYRVPWPGHWSLPASERCNCFPAGTLVSGDFEGAQRGWYAGAFTEIVTRNGARLSLTINHPVVTNEGLVAAGELKPGDKVLTYRTNVGPASGAPSVGSKSPGGKLFDDPPLPTGDDVDYKPAPIEQIFEAFSVVAPVEVKRACMGDFYGDGESIQGNIDIVRANWKLLRDGDFGQFKKRGNAVFILPDGGVASNEFGVGPGYHSCKGVHVSSSGQPRLAEPRVCRRLPVARVTPAGTLAVGVASDFDASLKKYPSDRSSVESGYLREALQRHSRFVQFDEVVGVRYFYSAGHVYDLQSRYGVVVAYGLLYTGIGIITSNCQCSVATEFGMMDPEAYQLIDQYNQRVEEMEAAAGEVWEKRRDGTWVGSESTPNYHTLVQRIREGKARCYKCGTYLHLLVHHMDGDSKNNAKNNLRVICDDCHRAMPDGLHAPQKGDLPGHPFRGNQWGGGGVSLSQAREMARDTFVPKLGSFDSFNGGVERTELEKDAVRAWGYIENNKKINEQLREGKDHSEVIGRYIQGLDSLMQKSSLPGNVVAYRGIVEIKLSEVGDVITDKGFSSTTLDERFAKIHAERIRRGTQTGAGIPVAREGTPVVLKIMMPKGSRVTTGAQSALELIVDRGSRYRILSKSKAYLFAALEQDRVDVKSADLVEGKGDLPGHPFRGNQWGQGSSSSVTDMAARMAPHSTKGVNMHTGEDEFLAEMAKVKGFDTKPTKVSDSEMDDHVRSGETEMFRGLAKGKYVKEFTDGRLFGGTGIFGGGVYTFPVEGAGGRDAKIGGARDYGGKIMRMSLKSGSKTVEYGEAMKGMLEDRDQVSSLPVGSAERRAGAAIVSDVGRWAMARGYDAIHVPSDIAGPLTWKKPVPAAQMVVLNRGALRVSEKMVKGMENMI